MDIKSAIQKLNSIDVEDLKKIDRDQVKGFFTRHLEAVGQFFLIGVALVFLGQVYAYYHKETRLLDEKETMFKKKIEEYERLREIKRKYQQFADQFPSALRSNELMDKILEIATKYEVRISSFSPTKETEDDLARFVGVDVTVSSDHYSNIVRFIHKLEALPYSLYVDKWLVDNKAMLTPGRDSSYRGRRSLRGAKKKENVREDQVQAKLNIISVELKKLGGRKKD